MPSVGTPEISYLLNHVVVTKKSDINASRLDGTVRAG